MASKTSADPTGQRYNRARTVRLTDARLERARRAIVTLFRDIPYQRKTVPKVRNQQEQPVYTYDLTPEQLEILNNKIRQILDAELIETEGNTVPIKWWYKQEIEQPVRQGTLEQINEYNQLIALALALGITGLGGMPPQRIAPEVILLSPSYLEELRNVYIENFQSIKSLSDNTAAQVIREINNGIKSGNTPANIVKNINTRFDVSESNAKRIVNTEVNKAYNDARMRAAKAAAESTGLDSFVRHISALLPTTRKHHAARHSLIYTVDQQAAWWDEGANRINCYCSVETVLRDPDGNYIGIGEIRGPSNFSR